MPEEQPNDRPPPEGPPSGDPGEVPRRRFLTPEQRRFLGAAPTRSDRARPSHEEKDATLSVEPPAPPGSQIDRDATEAHLVAPKEKALAEPTPAGEDRHAAQPASVALTDRKSSRAFEMQRVAIVIGCLFLLGAIFYLGTRVPGWLYLYRSHQRQAFQKSIPEKFPGISSDELVEQALIDQETGRWREAGERFLEARRKNNAYRGIFFMVGTLSFQHGDLDSADALFAAALASGENQEGANAFRAQIAIRRHDYAAAERFCEAATMAAPFVWTNYYQWAEVLRMNHNPREAIRRYEQAARRAPRGFGVIGCRYKVRLARIEARDPTVAEEITKKESEGPLPPEWLVTEAALKIDQGQFGDAFQLLTKARAATTTATFSSYVSDMIFQNTAQNNPVFAEICRNNNPSTEPVQ